MERHWGEKQKKQEPRKAGAEATEKHISVQDNRIYFYSGVSRNACCELNKKISELETKSITLSQNLDTVVGTRRYMSRNSYMLIHQLSTGFWGTYSNFEDEKQNLDLMMKNIKNVYKEYTKIPMKKLNEILKHDLMWDAKTCLEYGMVDEII